MFNTGFVDIEKNLFPFKSYFFLTKNNDVGK